MWGLNAIQFLHLINHKNNIELAGFHSGHSFAPVENHVHVMPMAREQSRGNNLVQSNILCCQDLQPFVPVAFPGTPASISAAAV